jgi:hypothetical protein
MNKGDVFVVPDLSQDFRFGECAFVTEPPYLRFYAGAPLLTVARPNGLSEDECATLISLSKMTMKYLVDRRHFLNQDKDSLSQSKMMCSTAQDMIAPLTSLDSSLKILNNDTFIQGALGEHQLALLKMAATNSELVMKICNNMVANVGQRAEKDGIVAASTTNSTPTPDSKPPRASVKDLISRITMFVDLLPKAVPCFVTLDGNVPNAMMVDDLQLFKCAINLLTNAIDRTSSGEIRFTVRWDGKALLLFECEDTAPDIPADEYHFLFQHGCDIRFLVRLSSIAQHMNSMEGQYGFRPKHGFNLHYNANAGNFGTDSSNQNRTGSTFWFGIPLLLPDRSENSSTHVPRCFNSIIEPVPISRVTGNDHSQQRPALQYCQTNPEAVGPKMDHTHPSPSAVARSQSNDCDRLQQIRSFTGNNDVSYELRKLAMDLNVSLAELEPRPIRTGIMNQT